MTGDEERGEDSRKKQEKKCSLNGKEGALEIKKKRKGEKKTGAGTESQEKRLPEET